MRGFRRLCIRLHSGFRDIFLRPGFFLAFVLFTAAWVLSCSRSSTNPSSHKLTIAVATSVQPALVEIARAFMERTEVEVVISGGSTGMLSQQIRQGAPFDLVFSADEQHVEELAASGYVVPSSVRAFARGRLVLWQSGDAEIRIETIEKLADALGEDGRLAIAKPEYAPYGKAAAEVLEHFGGREQFESRIVYANNVGQALQFARTGNVAAAFISASLVPDGEGDSFEIPANAYSPIIHAFAITSKGKQQNESQRFHDFVLGAEAQAILSRHGFDSPGGTEVEVP